MNSRRLTHLLTAIPVIASAVLPIALAAPAAAQSEACVHLQTGSGYQAVINVTFGNQREVSDLANPLTAGATQCLSLAAVPDGVDFSVQVITLGGLPIGPPFGPGVVCTPSNIPRAAALPVAITFNASGTVKSLHCTAPTSLVE
jgi:hypothetical protein